MKDSKDNLLAMVPDNLPNAKNHTPARHAHPIAAATLTNGRRIAVHRHASAIPGFPSAAPSSGFADSSRIFVLPSVASFAGLPSPMRSAPTDSPPPPSAAPVATPAVE
uniref:Uncharacterized protein n=1 Tax=Triticum urartu TaxID=4572 RepID=A0A8R7TTP0_TRIUA